MHAYACLLNTRCCLKQVVKAKCKRCAITVADASKAKARKGVNDFDAVLPVDTLVALAE